METTTQKHTTGNWEVKVWDYPESPTAPPKRLLILQNETHRIACIDWDEGKDNPYAIPHDEALANAHLFKAAPQLLQALKDIISDCGACGGCGTAYTMPDEYEIGQPRGSSGVPCPNCTKARETIAATESTSIALTPAQYLAGPATLPQSET